MTADFMHKTVALKFRLGEFVFFSARFSGFVRDSVLAMAARECVEPDELAVLLREVDVVYTPSYPVGAQLPRLSAYGDAFRYVPVQYDRFYIEIKGSFEDYLGKFSSKTRSTLKRKARKFAEHSGGQIKCCEFVKPEEMLEFHKLARQVAELTYQERLLGGALPAGEKFCEEMQELSRNDRVRAYVLFCETQPIAYLYCPMTDGVLVYDFLGYDPSYSDWSPGTVLQYVVLERLFREGRNLVFDFTEGAGPHKALFATNCIPCGDIYYFRRSIRSILIVCLHALVVTLSRSVTGAAKLIGVKSWLKKLIRSKA